MSTQVAATWARGVLKPDEELPLPEQSRVRLTIEPVPSRSEASKAWRTLRDRLSQRPIHASGLRFSRAELHERD